MSVETKIRLKGRVHPNDILAFIQKEIDENAFIRQLQTNDYGDIHQMEDMPKKYYGNNNRWEITVCWLRFVSPMGTPCAIFYFYSNCNFYENLSFYKKVGLTKMVKQETTTLLLDYSNESVKVMKAIVEKFGGWLDENDSDDEDYYFVCPRKEKINYEM